MDIKGISGLDSSLCDLGTTRGTREQLEGIVSIPEARGPM